MNKEKIEKMVDAYNKYAIKHGYDDSTIEVDYEKKEIHGQFVPKDTNTHKGFFGTFKNANIAGHNESLRADFGRIVEALNEL